MKRYCKKCGAYIPDKMNKCLACGWEIKKKKDDGAVEVRFCGKVLKCRIVRAEANDYFGNVERGPDGKVYRSGKNYRIYKFELVSEPDYF